MGAEPISKKWKLFDKMRFFSMGAEHISKKWKLFDKMRFFFDGGRAYLEKVETFRQNEIFFRWGAELISKKWKLFDKMRFFFRWGAELDFLFLIKEKNHWGQSLSLNYLVNRTKIFIKKSLT